MSTTPRIYVACLAAYNSGMLHGEWIDADQSADELHEGVQRMLKASSQPGAEEWAITTSRALASYVSASTNRWSAWRRSPPA